MVSERITLGQLLDSGIRLSWRESLAITQTVAGMGSRRNDAPLAGGEAHADFLSGFALEADGSVIAVTDDCRQLSLSELALFLVQLLPGDTAPVERRAPAAVHLAIGRALEVVEAPPFASVEEFSAVLARLENGSRPALLRTVYERCIARLAPAREPSVVSSAPAAPERATTEKVERDRRTSGPRVDALRRMIRERDHHDYLVRAERGAKRSRVSDRPGSRAHGPSSDTLRRWLREADRQQFEMLRTVSPATRWPSSMRPLAGLALAVFLTAGLGFAERQTAAGLRPVTSAVAVPLKSEARPMSAPPPRTVPTFADQALTGHADEPAPAMSTVAAAIPQTNSERNTPPAAIDRASAVGVTADGRPAGRLPSKRGLSAASKAAARAKRPTADAVIATAQVAPDPPTVMPAKPARRWGPLRLFAATRHRLSAAFNGA